MERLHPSVPGSSADCVDRHLADGARTAEHCLRVPALPLLQTMMINLQPPSMPRPAGARSISTRQWALPLRVPFVAVREQRADVGEEGGPSVSRPSSPRKRTRDLVLFVLHVAQEALHDPLWIHVSAGQRRRQVKQVPARLCADRERAFVPLGSSSSSGCGCRTHPRNPRGDTEMESHQPNTEVLARVRLTFSLVPPAVRLRTRNGERTSPPVRLFPLWACRATGRGRRAARPS